MLPILADTQPPPTAPTSRVIHACEVTPRACPIEASWQCLSPPNLLHMETSPSMEPGLNIQPCVARPAEGHADNLQPSGHASHEARKAPCQTHCGPVQPHQLGPTQPQPPPRVGRGGQHLGPFFLLAMKIGAQWFLAVQNLCTVCTLCNRGPPKCELCFIYICTLCPVWHLYQKSMREVADLRTEEQ